jgi:hypothetical protein
MQWLHCAVNVAAAGDDLLFDYDGLAVKVAGHRRRQDHRGHS